VIKITKEISSKFRKTYSESEDKSFTLVCLTIVAGVVAGVAIYKKLCKSAEEWNQTDDPVWDDLNDEIGIDHPYPNHPGNNDEDENKPADTNEVIIKPDNNKLKDR